MYVRSELNAANAYRGQRFCYRVDCFCLNSSSSMPANRSISWHCWESSGCGAGFVAEAVIPAARGAAGFFSKSDVHSGATRGGSNATAS
jgi:hypothetical protein